MYESQKIYGHERGLSCAFRQWGAQSHCNKLHGYALQVEITFEAEELDDRNWVVDFGGMKQLESTIRTFFDHTTVIAENDPSLESFRRLHDSGVIDLRVMKRVGCEAFAEFVYRLTCKWLAEYDKYNRVKVQKVTIREHGANSATYKE